MSARWRARLEAALTRAWLARAGLACALWPLSLLYGVFVALRRAAYRSGWPRQEHIDPPLVVVGNRIRLKLGDTGQLALKLEVVQRVMRRIQGAQRTELAYIDVTAPSRPAYGMRSGSTSTIG